MNAQQFNFAVFGTQDGGLVREVGGKWVFVEAPPNHSDIKCGEIMPREWGIVPANDLAWEMMSQKVIQETRW